MSSYDVLYNQLPDYFRLIIEFQAILKAHGYALDDLDATAIQIAANNYIPTCDADTLTYWERLLDISYQVGDTLEYRRDRVLQKFNTIVPFSIGFLNDRLTGLFGTDGYTLLIDYPAQTLTIEITSDRYGAVNLLYDLLWDIVPAHLQVIANQETTNNIGGSRLYIAGAMLTTKIITVPSINYRDIPADLNIAGFTVSSKVQTI